MKSISVTGYQVKIYNDGEVRIFSKEEELEEERILVIAKYLFDEGFIEDDEEIFINVVI
jgi:hypothetical protein